MIPAQQDLDKEDQLLWQKLPVTTNQAVHGVMNLQEF